MCARHPQKVAAANLGAAARAAQRLGPARLDFAGLVHRGPCVHLIVVSGGRPRGREHNAQETPPRPVRPRRARHRASSERGGIAPGGPAGGAMLTGRLPAMPNAAASGASCGRAGQPVGPLPPRPNADRLAGCRLPSRAAGIATI